ncbi:MAG TPA: glycosyltransferase family 2 protein [Devosiaceae bacterium]|nr:glycosyltransferase family 2 protein [Devosiaceae bacterium]
MPCLNEAETLAACIRKARGYLDRSGVAGEVVIADNGSTDGSREIARAEGARVIEVARQGYGAALAGGIAAARGKYVIMGDADDSYDFSNLGPFLDKLRQGHALVMGNRFRGGVAPGAMPALHRYLGNPALSFVGRLFFRTSIGDFHCGLRGFDRAAIEALQLRTAGMEFASEMVVKATLSGLRIAEVPTTLSPDGRSRPPHLRSWSDGWRHLRFLLLYSPRWLFLYPGLILMALGVIVTVYLLPGPVEIRPGVELDVHTMLVAAMCIIVGLQAISFAVIGRRFATNYGFIPRSSNFGRLLEAMTLERILVVALPLTLAGLAGLIWSVINWAVLDFGPLAYSSTMRVMIISMTAFVAGLQLTMTGFLSSMMNIPIRERRFAEREPATGD